MFAPAPAPAAIMHMVKGHGEIAQQVTEWTFKHSLTRNQDIIAIGPGLLWSNPARQLAQTPFGAIANNGSAKLSGGCKAKSRPSRAGAATPARDAAPADHLQDESGARAIASFSGLDEILALLERRQPEHFFLALT
jgi:hypothetical protein